MVAQGKTSTQIAAMSKSAERVCARSCGHCHRDQFRRCLRSEQIRVVERPPNRQFLPFKQKMTVLDVMIAAGGLTDFADGNNATITCAHLRERQALHGASE